MRVLPGKVLVARQALRDRLRPTEERDDANGSFDDHNPSHANTAAHLTN